MILLVGTNFDAATRKRYIGIATGFGELRSLAQRGRITLVFAAHDEAHNDAVVLRDDPPWSKHPDKGLLLAHLRSD